MVTLSPVIKLNASTTFGVINVAPLELVTVRLQDLVSKYTYEFNTVLEQIRMAGGVHNFLGFKGKILLSLIMKDEIIANFSPKKYAIAIDSLSPDYYTTIDGETYEGEYSCSLDEIKRIHNENTELVGLCPKGIPIGLVKGCNEKQLDIHIGLLKRLGINDYVFHVGDFFRHGDEEMIRKARDFSFRIRKRTKTLLLYGMGSQRRLVNFSFADFFITFNHFVTAKNGMKFVGTMKTKYKGKFRPEIAISNFMEMYKNLRSIENQTKLLAER